jgi:hypothetical protein
MKKSRAIVGMKSNDSWEVENDLRTLNDAEKIKCDPKRMKACIAMAKEKMMSMATIANEGGEHKE